MSREIKFRWFDKDHNRMMGMEEAIDSGIELESCFTFVNLVPMQYTGLKDKNGKEIYEGDLVKVFGDVSRVYYSEANACFNYQHEESPYSVEALGHYSSPAFEIIGNIHENPELLEAK